MLRYLLLCALVQLSVLPAHAGDPNQMFQNFIGFAQQLQQMEQQRQQEQELIRQQREVFIHQMVTACLNSDEVACRQILDTKGMSPYANYTAFISMGDIELQRGEREAAQSYYRYAIRWAAQMPDGESAQQTIAAKMAALDDQNPMVTQTTPDYANPPGDSQAVLYSAPESGSNPEQTTTRLGDLVCDAAISTKWKIACLETSQDPDGAKLHAMLGDALRQHNTTLRELLECETTFHREPGAGLLCYNNQGLSGQSLETVRPYVLEYDMLVSARLETKP